MNINRENLKNVGSMKVNTDPLFLIHLTSTFVTFYRDSCVCAGQGSLRVKENINIRISNRLNMIVDLKMGAPEMVHEVFAAVKFYKEQLSCILGNGGSRNVMQYFLLLVKFYR